MVHEAEVIVLCAKFCKQSKDGEIEDNWNGPSQGEGQKVAGTGGFFIVSDPRRRCFSNDAHRQGALEPFPKVPGTRQ